MNKYFFPALLLMASVMITGKSTMAADITTESLDQARGVVSSYMTAMIQGDTNAIKQLLGGTFLQKKQAMLDSSDYSSVLTGIYANASYEIMAVRGANNDQISVDVKLAINPSNIMNTQFIISRINNLPTQQIKYLITDEID